MAGTSNSEVSVGEPSIKTHRNGHVGVIELNRPKSINALDHEMALAMERTLREWETDDSVATVVVRGAGDRGLCAGGDIVAIHRDAKELSATGARGDRADRAAADSPSGRFWRDEYRLNHYISRYPKPYVALMDGIVMGGGVGISAHGNTRIVTDRTRLAMPEVGIGFVPDVGGTHLLARVPDQLGTYMALTTAPANGADAVALGIADHYVPAESLDALVDALATRPVGDVLAEFAVEPPASSLHGDGEWIAEAFATDDVAEIIANCRAVGSEGATKTADKIESKSPLALRVALRSLREAAATPSLAESLRREYRVSLRSLLHPDMAEGIRAQVIDKDRNPQWQPVADFTSATIDDFFAQLPDDVELADADRLDNPDPQEISNV
ncbi:enoyl-CoA hydratase/isomerase family protein [Gordonia desulfuricans]|uniref:3-hydroxyisobutyryl-CoA hydrolase n=1 Tax=Gordonia desulfuricans TaxID=89051 RepID=A0A7K3LU45_9ACTN|nr:enoyl-CoA hydratase/isomerase family protein [Gordonia desulfuricans]NDK91783.1 enoyl-CoA hydratase/isomerase family protein [Gordonia desulfuricans]